MNEKQLKPTPREIARQIIEWMRASACITIPRHEYSTWDIEYPADDDVKPDVVIDT